MIRLYTVKMIGVHPRDSGTYPPPGVVTARVPASTFP